MLSKIAFVTVSYRADLDRFVCLRESIKKHITFPYHHYVVVDDWDKDLFLDKFKSDKELSVLSIKDVLPKSRHGFKNSIYLWVHNQLAEYDNSNVKKFKNYIDFALGIPRGWILQQYIKLSTNHFVNEQDIVIMDSDIVFVKEMPREKLYLEGRFRLSRVTGYKPFLHKNRLIVSQQILKTDKIINSNFNYVGNLITFKKDVLDQLHKYIEKIHKQSFEDVILKNYKHLSEYYIYGLFHDFILEEKVQTPTDKKLVYEIWEQAAYHDFIQKKNFDLSEQYAVLVQSNLHVHPSEYLNLIKKIELSETPAV